MNLLTRSDLLSLERYAIERADFRARVIAHKKSRTVALGGHVSLLFEDRLTVQYQVQEMLRIERIFEAAGIQDELDAYNPLDPRRQQPEGNDAVRVPRRRRARRAPVATGRHRTSRLCRSRGTAAPVRARRRGPRAQQRRQDLGGAFPALRISAGGDRRVCAMAPACSLGIEDPRLPERVRVPAEPRSPRYPAISTG